MSKPIPAASPGLVAEPSLTLKRRFNAAPAKVYAAWTRPENLMRWFGPDDAGAVASAEADVREGGAYRVIFHTADGETHNVGGVYRDVIENERLVFTWAWITMPERESLVTLTFKADGDGTLFTLLHERFFDEAARDRHEYGWTGSLVKLERFLGQGAA